MLIEFSVENYRSFKERMTLSMVAARPDKALPQNVIHGADGRRLDLLRSAAVFGANASGKSNLLRAMLFASRFVQSSVGEGITGQGNIGPAPFKLDLRWAERPSAFEFVFLIDGKRYDYGFAADKKRVHEEWLYYYPHGRRRRLFVRTLADGGMHTIYGADWKGERTQIENMTRPDALYLSVSAKFNHPSAQTVIGWFTEKFREISWFPAGGGEFAYTCDMALQDEKSRNDILDMLHCADLGIEDCDIERIPLQESSVWRRLPEEARTFILSHGGPEQYVHDVRVRHRAMDAGGRPTTADLRLGEESDGTQKMFAIAGPWKYVLDHGCVVVVDELDARLHPSLTKWLIAWFHSSALNPHGAQLVFATHDDNLLDLELFRRDQIWFTEKDEAGATRLYSLWDFKRKPRRETNIRRGYLSGRYGAVPLLEDLPS